MAVGLLGGSVGLGGIYGAGGVVLGLEGFLWGWRESYGVAMELLRDIYGAAMGQLWGSHGAAMG